MTIIEELKTIVGPERVITESGELLNAGNPDYIVKAKTVEEIQHVLKLANEKGIPVVPKSSSIDYFDAAKPEQGGILLDLREMNKIKQIVGGCDRYVTIEPGVTFIQLQNELKKQGYRCMVPLGLPGSASVLSSYLERTPLLSGPIIILSEGSQCIFDMKVVLADGSTLHTGSGEVIPTKLNLAHFGPAGPDWGRVFTGAQGTMGIVAEMSIKIKHIAPLQKILLKPFDDLAELIDVFFKIKRIEIGKECLAISALNMACLIAKQQSEIESILSKLPPWTLVLNLNGWEEEEIEIFEEELDGLNIQFSTGTYSILFDGVDLEKILLDEFFVPNRLVKYRAYKPSCKTIPFYTELDRLPEFFETMEDLALEHGYSSEEMYGFIMPIEQARTCYCELNFFSNPIDVDAHYKVQNLFQAASEMILTLGGVIDRPYGIWSDMIYSRSRNYHEFLKTVKKMLDPNHILNPGKLLL
ncbi:MAG: FAD-binding oxidoreductase [Candidatus Helarchaeota archaeon]